MTMMNMGYPIRGYLHIMPNGKKILLPQFILTHDQKLAETQIKSCKLAQNILDEWRQRYDWIKLRNKKLSVPTSLQSLALFAAFCQLTKNDKVYRKVHFRIEKLEAEILKTVTDIFKELQLRRKYYLKEIDREKYIVEYHDLLKEQFSKWDSRQIANEIERRTGIPFKQVLGPREDILRSSDKK